MKTNHFSRLIQLIGEDNLRKIQSKKIIVFGVGGVGGQAAEALVRTGIEHITIVDYDVVEETNLNRQLIATLDVIGKPKVEVLKKRLLSINGDVEVNTFCYEVTETNIESFNLEQYDFVVDAIDSVRTKIALIHFALKHNIRIISAMGAGNRIDPTKVRITDIEKTNGCPLAKTIRINLRKNNLKGLKVVTSEELPLPNYGHKPGSTAFVPPAYGLAIASYIFSECLAA